MTEEKLMTPMTAREWLKYDWRIEVFLKKYKNKEPFELRNGQKVVFQFYKDTYDAMASRDTKRINSIILFGSSKGSQYKVSDIGKNKEFGGKGAGAGTAKEDRELESLKDQIDAAKAAIANSTVPITINGKKYDVYGAESTPGTPKSDFHLVDINGNEVVWISHKDGRTQKDFQQWGGISQRAEPKIYNHPEVQSFISDLKDKYPNGLPNATSFYRKIKDENLKMMSVYGNEYGSKMSRQNVSILLQGPVKLTKQGSTYTLTSYHTHYNGDDITGPYEPVLAAIYKGDRSDAGVKGTRIVIMPIQGRKMTDEI
jgi:hypothetical protein